MKREAWRAKPTPGPPLRYNLDKQLTQIRRPDGKTVDLAYDAGGRLSTMTLPRGQYSYSYNSATGQLAQAIGPSGSTISYTYDGFLPLKETEAGEELR